MSENPKGKKNTSTVLSIVALTVSVLSALFTATQAYDGHRVAEMSLKVAAIDHRPSVTVSGVDSSKASDGKQIKFSVTMVNDGSIVAANFQGALTAFLNGQQVAVKPLPDTMNLGKGTRLHHEIMVNLNDEQAVAVAAGQAQLRLVEIYSFSSEYDATPVTQGACFTYNPSYPSDKADYCDVLSLFRRPTQ